MTEECGAREPEPRTGTSPCVLPAGHGGIKHQDKWTNQWPAEQQPDPLTKLTAPALMATIKELRDLRTPLVDALALVYRSMSDCAGDEWAEEWLGEVWTQIPLHVRALAGDEDAAAELADSQQSQEEWKPCLATFREEPMPDAVYCQEQGHHTRHTSGSGSEYYAWLDSDEGAGWDPLQ